MAQHAMARRALLQARDAVVRSEGKLARFKLQAGEMVERFVQSAEVGIASFGMGVIKGRYAERADIFGIPPEAAAAVVLHIAGYAKLAGPASKHLHNLGDGSLAFWAGNRGRQLGLDMAREAGASQPVALPLAATPVAARAATSGYTDAEIAMQAARHLR